MLFFEKFHLCPCLGSTFTLDLSWCGASVVTFIVLSSKHLGLPSLGTMLCPFQVVKRHAGGCGKKRRKQYHYLHSLSQTAFPGCFPKLLFLSSAWLLGSMKKNKNRDVAVAVICLPTSALVSFSAYLETLCHFCTPPVLNSHVFVEECLDFPLSGQILCFLIQTLSMLLPNIV